MTKRRVLDAVSVLAIAALGCRALAGCGTDAYSSPPPSVDVDAAAGSSTTTADANASTDARAFDGARDDASAPLPTPQLVSTSELCKLINQAAISDPTPNDTQHHANIGGTDLGVPVDHEGTLFFFFGDTIGFKGIWQPGQSLPDAVGFANVPSASVASNPSLLCSGLRFLTLSPGASVGPKNDSTIEADFAAGAMNAPDGGALSDFIHNPAGNGAFPNLPGDFEVPSGAFSYGGSIYVFYTTVVGPKTVDMKGSYLVRWALPATTGIPSYDILYPVDERFDDAGALGGGFVNVAAEVVAPYVYLFGTGDYRKSPVYLARKRLDALATPGGFERFDAASKTWSSGAIGGTSAPIVADAVNGELSVRYFPEIGRWMMLNQEESPTMNRVIAHFASAPEGPWSDGVVVADMGDPAFQKKYCCAADVCNGEQLFHCDRAGFYATYMLPTVAVDAAKGTFTTTFVMSTWDPYDVALMRATFH
jgi:hypothetical protein